MCASRRKTCSASPRTPIPLIERVADEAIAATSAEAVGAMSEALEMTVDYLKTRKQFGVADRRIPGVAASRFRYGGGAWSRRAA